MAPPTALLRLGEVPAALERRAKEARRSEICVWVCPNEILSRAPESSQQRRRRVRVCVRRWGCVHPGVREVPDKRGNMRATRLIILGAASHVCCGQSLYHRDFEKISIPCIGNNGRRVYSRQQAERRREAPRPWFVSGGGAEAAGDDEPPTRWWRSRKRWAKRQAEKKAAEERVAASSSAAQIARKHVIAVQGLLRRLRRCLGMIIDIATLKRLRMLRQARQVLRRGMSCSSCERSAVYYSIACCWCQHQ